MLAMIVDHVMPRCLKNVDPAAANTYTPKVTPLGGSGRFNRGDQVQRRQSQNARRSKQEPLTHLSDDTRYSHSRPTHGIVILYSAHFEVDQCRYPMCVSEVDRDEDIVLFENVDLDNQLMCLCVHADSG
jgi:hypothetical protein